MQGIILRGIGGFYYALCEDGSVETLRAQAKLRKQRLKPKVGDRVEMQTGDGEEDGWIKAILPRRNELVRPPVANIDLMVMVVAAATPDPDLLLVDRMLVNAQRAGIAAQLVINKCDLDPAGAEAIAKQYAGAEVTPVIISSEKGIGLETLRTRLRGKVCAFAGQSGAGKSTTLNALYGLAQETGDLSHKIERGKNTTRQCALIPVGEGTMVLDTPGFSLLETELFDPVELKDSYPEFVPFEGKCFFQPCYHAAEPKCAARQAVEDGRIDRERHGRYTVLLEEQRLRWRERYD